MKDIEEADDVRNGGLARTVLFLLLEWYRQSEDRGAKGAKAPTTCPIPILTIM